MKHFHIFLAVMKFIPRFLLVTSLAASSSLLSQASAQAAVRPTEESAPKLPEIWVKAGSRERLKATRAAEVDADRLLAERIYGVQVDAETTVADFAMSDDKIASAVQASLVGSLTVGQPEFFADGRVEVVKAVKMEQVIETIRRKTKEKLFADGRSKTVSSDEYIDLSTKGKVLEVMGNAALPGSEGHQKVMAKRAAELDAYRHLAQRILDIRIDSQTTVRGACLESDEIISNLSQVLKGAEPVSIRYLDNGDCEVEMKINKPDIVRAVSNSKKGRAYTTHIEDSTQDNIYIEKGRGTMHPVGADSASLSETPTAPQNKSLPYDADVFFETETIIRRLLDSKPVQH
jgi:hypothetical protein